MDGNLRHPRSLRLSCQARTDSRACCQITGPPAKSACRAQTSPVNLSKTPWSRSAKQGVAKWRRQATPLFFFGPIFSDYAAVGFAALIQSARMVEASPERIPAEGQVCQCIVLSEFMTKPGLKLTTNPTSLDAHLRIQEVLQTTAPAFSKELVLSTRRLFSRINEILDDTATLVADTGDSRLSGMDLLLPNGCKFEIQMQYGSFRCLAGAFLGLTAAHPQRRVMGVVGAGSFQMTAQEVSTILWGNYSGIMLSRPRDATILGRRLGRPRNGERRYSGQEQGDCV